MILYKRDSKGKVRVWSMELDGDRFRTTSGLQDGQLVTSGWTTCIPKSKPTGEEQAAFEVESSYKHQTDRDYYENIADIDSGGFFQVMLAEKYKGWPGHEVYSQPKLDGFRCVATKDGLCTRQGKPIPAAAHVLEALAPLFALYPNARLDGELYNHDLRHEFQTLSSILKKQTPNAAQLAEAAEKVQYWVYDLPSHEGWFSQRSVTLSFMLEQAGLMTNRTIKCVTTNVCETEAELDEMYATYLQSEVEGQMVRLDESYRNARSSALQKRKEFQCAEFDVVSIDEGNGNWAGLAKRVTCRLPDGREFGAGIKGNMERAAELLTETHKQVTVRFFRYTDAGIPYLPVVTAFHGEGRTL